MNGIETLVTVALRGRRSARGCRRCGGAITLDDGFGLSEGVCRACVWQSRGSEPPSAGDAEAFDLLQRLRRAA